jgi:hypothetical protein
VNRPPILSGGRVERGVIAHVELKADVELAEGVEPPTL